MRSPLRPRTILLLAFVVIAPLAVACSGGTGQLAAGLVGAEDASSEENDGDADAGASRTDAKTTKNDAAGVPNGHVRVGPEHFGAVTRDLTASDAGTPPVESLLRCPRGDLLTGIELGGPDPNGGPIVLDKADRIRLVCSTLAADGSLGPGVATKSPIDPSLTEVWTPVRCPNGKAATRVVGTWEGLDFRTLGLRCDAPDAIVDGASIGAGSASTPATLGGTAGSHSFDDPCPAGTALNGFALQYTSLFQGSGAAGFTSMRALCREVLDQEVPGGGAYDLGKPFSLGQEHELYTLPVTTFPLPDVKFKKPLDCPDGSIVSGVDVGRTPMSGPVGLYELGLTCRALKADGSLGDETHVGIAPESPAVARCLDGAAIAKLAFTKQPLGIGFENDAVADDVIPSCAIAAPGVTAVTEASPPAAPGYPDLTEPPWKAITCPPGEVLTGLDLWRGDEPDAALQGVTPRCRAAKR